MWDQLLALLAHNQIVTGGAILGALAGLFSFARKLPELAWNKVSRHFYCTLRIEDSDPTFAWILAWHMKNCTKPASSQLAIAGSKARRILINCDDDDGAAQENPPLFPVESFDTIRWRNRRIIMRFFRIDNSNPAGGPPFRDVVTVTIPFCDRTRLHAFLDDARHCLKERNDSRVPLYVYSCAFWNSLPPFAVRSMNSLCLDDSLAEDILTDARTFLTSKEWYHQRGIPWRRGYLLHGPPGNGKSSLARVLASELDLPLAILQLSGLSDDGLREAMMEAPDRAIILIEDVDCAAVATRRGKPNAESADKEERNGGSSITLSGFLNALDGSTAPEGHIVIMTTNRPEVLDEALRRPGRMDRSFLLGNATPQQAAKMFRRFFTDCTEKMATDFACQVPSGCCMAALQGHFLQYRHSAQLALDRVGEIRPAIFRSGPELLETQSICEAGSESNVGPISKSVVSSESLPVGSDNGAPSWCNACGGLRPVNTASVHDGALMGIRSG